MSRARDHSRVVSNTILTLDGSNNVGLGSTQPASKFNVTGIVSATSFFGDGSNLDGVASAGLGTALGESEPLDVVYYTDKFLNITDDTTITVPTGSDVAYTQYAEIVVADSKDLIISDGDEFVPDILGITTIGIEPIGSTGGGRVRAGFFTNRQGNGAPEFQTGLTVTGNLNATGESTFTGNIKSTGIATATAFAGHDYIQAPFGSTVIIDVVVASKDATHRYNGQGSGNGYKIDGVFAPYLTLSPGRTYRFRQFDSSNDGHPIIFYLEADRQTEYTTGVSYYADGNKTTSAAYNTDFNAATDRHTQITITDNTPTVLHYQCYNHGLMGNSVNTNSNGGTFASALIEKCNYDNTTSFGSAAEYNHDVLTHGNLAYYAQNSAGSWIYNIRGDSSTSLNSIMSVGQSISVTYITTQTNITHYQTGFKIDGTANTPEWQGGSPPSVGSSSGFNLYTFTIIKTADATFKTFAALTNNN
tara:strand:- start:4013 stop:5434 length:1422 start_codon:yes stop_codon:yes gene_type:complete